MVDDLQRKSGKQDEGGSSKPEVIMESNTDSAEWKLEVERVLPQLKLTIRADNKVSTSYDLPIQLITPIYITYTDVK